MKQDEKMIIKGAEMILKGLGINTHDADFINTPKRISNSLLKYIAPRSVLFTAKKHLQVTFPSKYIGPITFTDMRSKSMCPHHLMPIIYHASLTYFPQKGMVVGSSKPDMFLKDLSRLPIMQEELTMLFGKLFDKLVKPKGLIFELRGRFLCYENDGIHSDTTEMVTSYRSGIYKK